MPADERTPLLDDHARNFWAFGQDRPDDYHAQFCKLVGIPPSDLPPDAPVPSIGPKTLYGRALKLKRDQSRTYAITAAISNTLLLAQVVLGAAVTALGASESSHVLITLFGAANTIIAGVVAYLKSRGQPMRARMYRDDLERVVDEIENSEIMWLGISKHMHGYSEIDTDDEVTVRSEIARLTRLYDRAVRTNSMNNPDMYMAGQSLDNTNFALRKGPLPSGPVLPAIVPPVPTTGAGPSAPAPSAPVAPLPIIPDPDESPASAPPKPKDDPAKDKSKDEAKTADSVTSKSNGKASAEAKMADEENVLVSDKEPNTGPEENNKSQS
ncbi:uncharacterized protein PV09_04608 [Verruconis gallopava]|uniref:SMODS and SLOG-associating 2TM effector domain-containing protein n=1 Tax=Verruconis gallopava TaxID=253628 RepID=A0A0D2ACY0_9PEZI|nr:uncharacterized protein PV09_04608 [Verruconis gallopava]KIW04315.1 hypothetical protein PV09_04608 [Verruconis gallopava]